MKSFKQFLSEDDKEFSDEFTNSVTNNCGQFLKDYNHRGFLWRGINRLKDDHQAGEVFPGLPFYKVPVRKDRQSLNMPASVTKVMDDYFNKNFGVKPRSQGVFCFGDKARTHAQGYGSALSAVFPIGKFKCIWSPNIHDLWESFSDASYNFEMPHDENDKSNIVAYDEDKIREWMDDLQYTDGDFDQAVASTSELMIVCDSYYATPIKLSAVIPLKHALKFIK